MKKFLLLILIAVFIFPTSVAFASDSLRDNATNIDGDYMNAFPSLSATFSAGSSYNPTEVQVYCWGHGTEPATLSIKSGGSTLFSCNASYSPDAIPAWIGCTSTGTHLTSGLTYSVNVYNPDANPDNVLHCRIDGALAYKIFGTDYTPGAPVTPGAFLGINLPGSALADVSQYLGQAFSSMWVLLAMIAGLQISFWVIKKTLDTARFR